MAPAVLAAVSVLVSAVVVAVVSAAVSAAAFLVLLAVGCLPVHLPVPGWQQQG
jgi:hypothetical protein